MAVRDRIAALRGRQAQVHVEMEQILTSSEGNENGELTAEQQAQYDALVAEDDRLTAGIAREEDMERRRAAAARPVASLPTGNPRTGGTVPAQAAENLEPGIGVSRLAQAIAGTKGHGGIRAVLDYSEKTWGSAFAATAASNMEQSVDVQGGFLVNTSYSRDLIAALQPNVVVRKMGASQIPLVGGNLTMRRQTGVSNAAWTAERDPIPTTAPEVDSFTMSAKTLAAIVPITNKLLRYSSIETDVFVRNDLVRAIARTEDQQFIRGQGAVGIPTGLRYLANAANIIAANATANVQNVRNDLGKLQLALENNNIPMTSPGYIISPNVAQFLGQLLTETGAPAFPEIKDGMIGAYPFAKTTSIPSNLGANGNQSEIYFVDFAQILIGDAFSTTLAVSTDSGYYDADGKARFAFQTDETLIRVIEEVDLNTRYDTAIAVLTDAAWFPGAVAGQ